MVNRNFDITVNFDAPVPEKAEFFVVKGDKGDKGDRGDPFTYEDFTAEQLKGLRGPQGVQGQTGPQGQQGPQGTQGIQGQKGNAGDPGNGIVEAAFNANDTLTLTFTDGTSYTTPSIRGPRGQTGQAGEPGEDGHSPVVTASKSEGVTTISVDGTPIATINDGQDGAQGHSPVVSASKVGNTTTIYVDGRSIATIDDGVDGEQGPKGDTGEQGPAGQNGITPVKGTDYWTTIDKTEIISNIINTLIDDTAGENDSSKVWSANKIYNELTLKMNNPINVGSNTQILTINGSGDIFWEDRQIIQTPNIINVISTQHQLNVNSCHVEKMGRLISLTFSITATSDIAQYGVIANVSAAYRPVAQIWGYAYGMAFDITGGGNIRPISGPLLSGRHLQSTIVYYCVTP